MHKNFATRGFGMTLAYMAFLSMFLIETAGSPAAHSLSSLTFDESSEVSELNRTCHHNDDCLALLNTFCDNATSKCACKQSFSPVSPTVCGRLLGDECHNGQCYANRSVCDTSTNRCICEFGLKPKPDKMSCYGSNFRIQLLHGDYCDHDENCSLIGENVICVNHSCLCKDNYIFRGSSCKEKLYELGADCDEMWDVCYEEDDFDGQRRACLGGKCRCEHRFIPHNGTCKEKISLLGAPCNANYQACHLDADGKIQKLECRQGICQCRDEYALHKGKCRTKIETLGMKCNESFDVCFWDDDRNENARDCINGTCQCNNAFVPSNGFCMQKIGLLGAPCDTSSQICFINEDGEKQKVDCIEAICQYKNEFALQNDLNVKQSWTTNAASVSPFQSCLLIALFASSLEVVFVINV